MINSTMNKNEIKQVKEAIDISEQIRSNQDTLETTLQDYMNSDSSSFATLYEKLNNSERINEISANVVEFDAKASLNSVRRKIKRENRKRMMKLFVKVASAAAAGVVTIVFLLSILDRDRNQVVYNYESQPVIPEDIKVPTLIDDLGNLEELEKFADVVASSEIQVDTKSNKISYVGINNDVPEVVTVYNELVMPSKYIYTLELSDGSEVIVNAGSKIKYPTTFTDSLRIVELSGEAFFNITKSDKPFIVRTKGMDIKVYGTTFNVNTYNDKTEAVLLSGSIGATIGEKEIMMVPNEMLVVEDSNVTISKVNPKNFVNWMESDFDYRRREMEDVLKDISRWYGIVINTKMDISNITVSLYSSRNKDLLSVLELIELSAEVKFVREGGNIYSLVEN